MYYLLWKRDQLDGLVDYFKNGKFKEIHNLNDNELGEVTCAVIHKIHDYVTILESEYCTDKYHTLNEVESNLGGFIVYVDDTIDDNAYYSKIMEKYNLHKDEAEVSEIIAKTKNKEETELVWCLYLYCMLDFNIVIINNSNNGV